MEDKEFYWDWLKHEDNLFTNRCNFFLLAESMFLAGSTQLLPQDSGHAHNKIFLFIIGVIGFIVSLIWLCSSINQLLMFEKKIKAKLSNVDERWKEIHMSPLKCPKIHPLMGYYLPILFLIAWCFLLPYITFMLPK